MSVIVSDIYYNEWPSSCDTLGLLAFGCLAPYIAWAKWRRDHGMRVMAFSVLLFTSVGCSIADHFGLSVWYGIAQGLFQGTIMGFSVTHANAVFSESALKWWLCVATPYVCASFLVSTQYGIDVTLPVQLYRFPVLIQPISVFGAFSLEVLLISSNVLLGSSLRDKRCLLVLFLVLVGWTSLSVYLWHDEARVGSPTNAARVATISPGRSPNRESDLIHLTKRAASRGAKFIVWPELCIEPLDYTHQPCEEYVTNSIAPKLGVDAYVVIGCLQSLPDPECPTANLAITVDPSGTVIGVYGKQHPVSMIGEKSCMTNGYRKYQSNDAINFSTLICYDMDFPDSTAHVADMGVSLVLNPSEDWAKARGHFAAAVFRSIENRVAVAKSDWGWDSVIISPFGEILSQFTSDSLHRETLIADVNLVPQSSRFNYYRQHLIPWTCTLVVVMYLARVLTPRIGARKRTEPNDVERSLLL